MQPVLPSCASPEVSSGRSPTVTVLIAARNEEATLGSTLASIAGQTYAPETVIVVDDGSTDATARIADASGARVVRLRESGGSKSRAHDAALSRIDTDLVVIVDADTELAPEALERLVAPFAGPNPPEATCGYVLPRQVESVWQRSRLVELLFGQFFYKSIQSAYRFLLVTSGCLACFPTATIRRRGGFGSRLLAEDMDLTTWIETSGGRWGRRRPTVSFVRDAYAYTVEPRSFELYRGQIQRWYAGFFQNVKLHRRALFVSWRNPPLSLFVVAVLFDTLVALAMLPLLPVLAVREHWPAAAWVDLSLTMMAVEVGVVTVGAALGAVEIWWRRAQLPGSAPPDGAAPIRRDGRSLRRLLGAVALSIPCFVVTNMVNRLYFFRAFCREMIGPLVGVAPLSTWNRGH